MLGWALARWAVVLIVRDKIHEVCPCTLSIFCFKVAETSSPVFSLSHLLKPIINKFLIHSRKANVILDFSATLKHSNHISGRYYGDLKYYLMKNRIENFIFSASGPYVYKVGLE